MKSILGFFVFLIGYIIVGLFIWSPLLTTTNFILIFGFAGLNETIQELSKYLKQRDKP